MTRKTNYELRSIVMRLGLPKIVSDYDFISAETDFLKIVDIEKKYYDSLIKYGLEFIKEARRINRASYSKRKRINDRIKQFLETGNCIFCTLTFTDDVLKNTNQKTRRKYISRFLKSISDYYIANIDFGIDDQYTHREHYHAVVLCDFIDDKWDYGFAWYEKVHANANPKLLARYITKLTNHAVKFSTKRYVYIYSRYNNNINNNK